MYSPDLDIEGVTKKGANVYLVQIEAENEFLDKIDEKDFIVIAMSLSPDGNCIRFAVSSAYGGSIGPRQR